MLAGVVVDDSQCNFNVSPSQQYFLRIALLHIQDLAIDLFLREYLFRPCFGLFWRVGVDILGAAGGAPRKGGTTQPQSHLLSAMRGTKFGASARRTARCGFLRCELSVGMRGGWRAYFWLRLTLMNSLSHFWCLPDFGGTAPRKSPVQQLEIRD